ncbi:beta strand repeat-containing protein [Mesorhizobium sp. IMUNJ 23232]|uniref:beta strand repeat-containing protein n=1 Tax=Mesorhizobium sp. IMUNJ 23232 TaxID=3376064 RepID=UPI0037B5ECEA
MTTTPILWRADQQANTTDSGTTGDDQTGIKMVGLANGNFVALWESNTDDGAGSSGGTDIIGQLYDAEGNPIGSEFRANQGFFADDEGDFTAAGLPGGGFVIAYEDTDVNGTAIRYNILDANGVNVTTGTIASDPGAQDLGAPSVTVNTDGSFLVAYQQRNVGASTETHATIVDSAGVAGLPFLLLAAGLSSDVGANGQQVDVTTLVNTVTPGSPGNYVIIARQISGDNGFNMRIVNSTGGNVLGFTEVSGTLGDGESDVAPTVAALSGGGFVVVWQNTDANDTDILFQRYDAAGVAQGGQVNVDDDSGTDNDVTPDVVGLSDGGFVVVWDNNEAGNIAMKRFDANGALVGSEQVVATDLFVNNGTPSISLSDDGRLLVSWGTSIFTGGINFDNDVRFAVWDPREITVTGDGTGEVITAFADGGTVNAGGGNDTIFGRDTADILRGEDGDDTIHGRGGDDTIEGGFNGDTIFGEDGNDTIFAMTQALPDDSGVSDTISGGNGDDTITGSAAGDTIGGDADNDRLDGGGGADNLQGGAGLDTFVYNTGEAVSGEIIDGGADDDRVLAQSDETFVDATFISIEEIEFDASFIAPRSVTVAAAQIGAGLASNLVVDFNANNTVDKFRVEMLGATSVDLSLFQIVDFDPAGTENDRIIILGDADDETMRGTIFRDELFGQDGNDVLDGGQADDLLSGGLGLDRASYANGGPVTANLFDAAKNTGEATGDTYASIENLTGSGFNDDLTGNNGGNSIIAGAGDDIVAGLNGDDSMFGQDGNDVLEGGVGADNMSGGAGNDRATYANAAAGIVAALLSPAQNTGEALGDIFTSIENLTGSKFDDTLKGTNSVNSLIGGEGDDTIVGFGGDDSLFGQDGNDVLNGGTGADNLSGGLGFDRATYEDATAGVTAALLSPATNTGDAAGDTFTSVENLTGSDFDDKLTGTNSLNSLIGGDGKDTLIGLGGDDNLFGQDGDDTFDGGAGADDFSGGAGTDTVTYNSAAAGVVASLAAPATNTGDALGDTYSSTENVTGSAFGDTLTGNNVINVIIGGAGSDTLNGRGGNDTLTGNAGKDQFLFDTAVGATNVDTITDFIFVDDTIRLENTIFNAIVGTGTLTAAQFVANASGTAADANDRIIYETDTGNIFYDTNGNAAGGSTLFAIVDAGLGITNADFLII